MISFPILTMLVLVPTAGSILVAVFSNRRPEFVKLTALLTSVLTGGLSVWVLVAFDKANADFQFVTKHIWIKPWGISWHLGVDGISLFLVVLTGVIFPIVIAGTDPHHDTKRYLSWMLLLEAGLMGSFLSLDLFLFFVFFEIVLVPMYFLIAGWGYEGRVYAATKFFLFTMVGSAFMLVGIIATAFLAKGNGPLTFDLIELAKADFAASTGRWLFFAFAVAFAVKVPIFPLHGWLKDAICEAPTAAVMVLAGKTGLYSILRFSFAIFPEQSHRVAPLMIALGAIGIVFGSLIAITRKDMKELAAYSTLGHLSFVTLGIFTFTISGLDGGIYQILNHGISGGALFLLLGFLYERYGTYDMRDLGGLAAQLPWMVTLYVVTTLSLIGLPMLNSFVGEFLILSGSMQANNPHHILWTVMATTGVILSAGYMLLMIQRVFYGSLGVVSERTTPHDLNFREHVAMWPLVALMLLMGVASPYWMKTLDANGVSMATVPSPVLPVVATKSPLTPSFVDPELKAGALHEKATPAPEGRRY